MHSALMAVAFIFILYAAPALIEDASGSCNAIAIHMNALDTTSAPQPAFVQQLNINVGTILISELAGRNYRPIPRSVACALGYWMLRMNPENALKLMAQTDDTIARERTAEYLLKSTPQQRAGDAAAGLR